MNVRLYISLVYVVLLISAYVLVELVTIAGRWPLK